MTTATSHTSIAPLLGVLRLNEQLIWDTVEDISPEHISARANDEANSFHWLLGHITSSRIYFANTIGIEFTDPFENKFNGGEKARDSAELASVKDIRAAFDDVSAKINSKLAGYTEEELLAPIEAQYPGQEKNLLGAIGFWQFHDSIHVGQLMILRRVFGYCGVFDKGK